jgi:hypothetical protein
MVMLSMTIRQHLRHSNCFGPEEVKVTAAKGIIDAISVARRQMGMR